MRPAALDSRGRVWAWQRCVITHSEAGSRPLRPARRRLVCSHPLSSLLETGTPARRPRGPHLHCPAPRALLAPAAGGAAQASWVQLLPLHMGEG